MVRVLTLTTGWRNPLQYDIILPLDETTFPFRTSQSSILVLQTGGDVPSKSYGHQTMYKLCSCQAR